ncbi:hypothetical protein DICPUDRAFT_51834 [Dictyostelium purpureum]|uniref:FNIP repeat-containing protein n=1 Tax=Dictyostelium purpureum TaxID=5786 RepID=F1A5S0_DICPU|nr:uncharacterized protein DICPUDRAFT_51834 [Dictyostelium purpureum]EGC28458.1 hypothetical protein DICPUDRAFT_51834 [Dictyostelium purpureum]|eukprot:XP_003295014.1 hypothetical protein DICPUDRAFT_51834 [Dictyostelium purpureum]
MNSQFIGWDSTVPKIFNNSRVGNNSSSFDNNKTISDKSFINNNNNNNDNNFNSIINTLFFKIWRNCYLKKKILSYLKLINIHFQRRIYSIETYLNYKFKDYLRYVMLDFKDKDQLVELLKTLPINIKSVSLNYFRFKEKLEPGSIPESITEFKFNGLYDAPLNTKLFSSSLKSLVKNYKYLYTEGFTLPRYLTFLSLGLDFNYPLDPGVLPKNLLKIKFGSIFNKPIRQNVLPETLTDIHFGDSFNQPLPKGILGNNLKKLELGFYWDQPLKTHYDSDDNTSLTHFPNSIETLKFGRSFNRHIGAGSLPKSLTVLDFCWIGSFNKPFDSNTIPSHIKSLHLGLEYNSPFNSGVLSNLINLQELYFGIDFNHPFEPGMLPPNLKTLCLSQCFNHRLEKGSLPPTLTSLSLGSEYNHPFEKDVLPKSIVLIELGSNYNFDLPFTAIPNIKTIIVRNRPNIIPEEIKSMDGETHYIIPKSLESIIIFSNNTFFLNKIYLNPHLFDYIKVICSSKIISKKGKLFKKINYNNI